MNSASASLMAGLGLCLALFPVLVCKPTPAASAQSPQTRCAALLGAFAGFPLAAGLAGVLLWILLFHLPDGAGLMGNTGLLILATATGIGLLPVAFPTRFPGRSTWLEMGTHFTTGLAWASCWLSAGEPTLPLLLVAGAAGGLLPDTLDHWIARLLRRIDIHIVPDPLDPQPGIMASALAQAISRCRIEQRPLHLEIYPGRNCNGHWLEYQILMNNRESRITVVQGISTVSCNLTATVSSPHPFALETGDEPLSLDLSPMPDGRVRMEPMPWQRGWSHSLLAAILAGLLLGLAFGSTAGLIAGGAWALHILLDQMEFHGSAWAFPFPQRHKTGFQQWRPEDMTACHIGVLWLGILVIGWNLIRIVMPGATPVNLAQIVIFAGLIPLAIGARVWSRKGRVRAPAGSRS